MPQQLPPPAGEAHICLDCPRHLGDVYVTSTVRLHRARTEDRPRLEPMLNDLRAQRVGRHVAGRA